MPKQTLLSGIKPSGTLHVGNYFGALKYFVELQSSYASYVFIANYHALTTVYDKDVMRKQTIDIALDYLACGLDPSETVLFRQSDVPEHCELAWILNCVCPMGLLERAHAYKDAQAKNKQVNVGLFDYPVLMAADILIYGADIVPVGKDQKQHVEIARDLAEKFNHLFGDILHLPEPLIHEETQTVVGLDGQKMSKSYNNIIPLFADDATLKKCIMSIQTDSIPVEKPKDPDTCNVFALYRLFAPEHAPNLRERYLKGGLGYGDAKKELLEHVTSFITPLREKRAELAADPKRIEAILEDGAARARKRITPLMERVREATGLS